MALSSNTIIHFTNKKEALLGILEDNFRISFCKEGTYLGDKRWTFYVPMVSFCDIPMSEIKDHIGKYGSYGIGLTKEWALEKRLNPVLYVSRGSFMSENYRVATKHFLSNISNNRNIKATNEADENGGMALLDIFRYMKNYEGKLERKSEEIDNYRFSDEREWRYVPEFSKYKDMMVQKKEFDGNTDHYSSVYKDHRLEFEPDDIKYIIINDDSEIKEIVSHLRFVKGGKYSSDAVERLTTRILTAEQIKGDF